MYCFSHNVFPPSTYENVVLLANLFTYVQTLCLFTYFARKFTTTFLARLLAYDVRYTRRSFECRKTCIILSQSLKIPIAHRLLIHPSILNLKFTTTNGFWLLAARDFRDGCIRRLQDSVSHSLVKSTSTV